MLSDPTADVWVCEWGRQIGLPGDEARCDQQATQIVVLHNGPMHSQYKLCARHRDTVEQQTDPHQGENG